MLGKRIRTGTELHISVIVFSGVAVLGRIGFRETVFGTSRQRLSLPSSHGSPLQTCTQQKKARIFFRNIAVDCCEICRSRPQLLRRPQRSVALRRFYRGVRNQDPRFLSVQASRLLRSIFEHATRGFPSLENQNGS